jgi:hypothetical protein
MQDKPLLLSLALKTIASEVGDTSPTEMLPIKSGAARLYVNCPAADTAVLLIIDTHVEDRGFRQDKFAELLGVKHHPLRVIVPPAGPEVGETLISGVTSV